MKKLFRNLMIAAIAAFGIASCDDVPAPFIEPGGGTDEPEVPVEAVGDGTLESPYNVAAVLAYIDGLDADVESAEAVYVKGKVKVNSTTESTITQYGNMTFDMIDEGNESKVFKAFQVYGPGNKKFTSVDQIKVGDEVVVYGKVVNFRGNTPETVGKGQAYVVSINGGEGGDEPEVPADGGTWDKPFSVAQLISNQTGSTVWVHGYIVGAIPESAASTTLENMVFSADGAQASNICIAGSPSETVVTNCVPVQLPAGSDVRSALNLKENPDKLGVEVWLKGTSEKYCGAPGLKSVSKFTLVAPTEDDDKEAGDTPAEGAKGDGSLENPFNPAGALNFTSALPAGETTAEKYYIKGIVCESNKMDISVQYKNATFYISEDGTTNGAQFYIFRTKGLNGADITSADDVKVGDEVVVYASLVNYMGNTPETAQGGMIYSQKRNGEELNPGNPGGGDEGGDEGGDTPVEGNIFANGDFEQWENGVPVNWKSASSAGNVTVTQSTEAHGGTYAASMGYAASANKRMAYKEITLPAGTYKFSFYARGTNTAADAKCQTRPGYVGILADGSADSQHYQYGSYVSLSATEWTLVEHEFTLTEEKTICPVIMAPKNSDYHTAQNILVDDATLVKLD